MPPPVKLKPSKERKPAIRPSLPYDPNRTPERERFLRAPYYTQLNWRTEASPSQAEEAKQFLGRSLGYPGLEPVEGSGEHYRSWLRPSWQYQNEPRIHESATEEFKNAVESLRRQHPIASTVTGYSLDPEMEKGIGGRYYPGTGYISLSGNKQDPLYDNDTYRGLMGTLRHELGHHLGAVDDFSSEQEFHPVEHAWNRAKHDEFSAYDIGRASDYRTGDIYLPSREEDIAKEEEEIRRIRSKYAGRDIELPNKGQRYLTRRY